MKGFEKVDVLLLILHPACLKDKYSIWYFLARFSNMKLGGTKTITSGDTMDKRHINCQ
jgi:hypothetical protein